MMQTKDCVITGIKYDKKARTLIGSLFIPEPREMVNDATMKEIFGMVRQKGLNIKDKDIVLFDLYKVIEENLL